MGLERHFAHAYVLGKAAADLELPDMPPE